MISLAKYTVCVALKHWRFNEFIRTSYDLDRDPPLPLTRPYEVLQLPKTAVTQNDQKYTSTYTERNAIKTW